MGWKVDQSGARQYEQIFNSLKRLAITAAAAIGATELIKGIIETTSAWQQENLQLSYIIGNTQKAHALMLQLNSLASHSPFTRDELSQYAKSLINFGFSVEEITPLMSRLANIAAVLGTDKIPLITEALARMKQHGAADARVMMELFHAGIPIQEVLAKRFNLTTFQMNKLIQEGRVGFRDVYQALTDLTTGTGKFAGANEAYAKTLAGQWKGVLHVIDDLKTTLGTSLLPVVQKLLTAFRDWLEVNKGHLADDMIRLLNTIAYVLGWIVGRVRDLLVMIGALPDPNKTKEVSAAPGANEVRIPGTVGRFLQTGSLPKPPPPFTHQQMTAAAAADRSRLEKAALSLTNNNTFNFNGFGGDRASAEAISRLATIAAEEANKRAIRQAAPSFTGANQ